MSTQTSIRSTLGLPHGSVRAFLALCVTGSAYWLIATGHGTIGAQLPEDLGGTVPIVLGYYFANRSGQKSEHPVSTTKPAPLYLPKGTVRALLIFGFLAAIIVHFYQSGVRLRDVLHPTRVMVDIASFLIGRCIGWVVQRFGHHEQTRQPSKATIVFRDLLGIVLILIGIATVLVYCVKTLPISTELRTLFRKVFPPMIAFYFGTR